MNYTTHTEDFVKELYIRMDILTPDQLNYKKIATMLGIKVFPAPYENGPSQALFAGEIPFIFLEQGLDTAQQWQDFCHELSHVLTDCGNQGSNVMPRSWIEYQENKANSFMYHACMPTFMLDALEIHSNNVITVMHLQRIFNVEYDFAAKRLTQYINKKIMLNWHNATRDNMLQQY